MTLADYFADLWRRRGESCVLEPRDVRYQNGDAPLPSNCHSNVDRWVKENDGWEAVRGWLVMNYGFERHSVARTASGQLIDITLSDIHQFLPHDDTQIDFDQFDKAGCNQVLWPQISN